MKMQPSNEDRGMVWAAIAAVLLWFVSVAGAVALIVLLLRIARKAACA
jgi:hypothetical protein